jgi:hypothetical protein
MFFYDPSSTSEVFDLKPTSVAPPDLAGYLAKSQGERKNTSDYDEGTKTAERRPRFNLNTPVGEIRTTGEIPTLATRPTWSGAFLLEFGAGT